jgi:hypothetical protein
MSFSRLNYDQCTYQHNLKQSIGAADYQLNTPRMECHACFPPDPSTRIAAFGASLCGDKPLIDVDSELRIITRKASNCPTEKYLPGEKAFCVLKNLPDCRSVPNETTRLSNPSCTLRCTGWNRWEWLCQNPQNKALVPFDFNISNRIVVKDNHRPCIPTPIDQSQSLPPLNNTDDMVEYNMNCIKYNTDIPSTHWRKCSTYQKYV